MIILIRSEYPLQGIPLIALYILPMITLLLILC